MLEKEVIEKLEKRIQDGDVQAMVILGSEYMKSDMSDEENQKKTFYYWKMAADRKNVECQHQVGNLYSIGLGCQKDLDKAREYYLMAAQQNNKEAQLALANLLLETPKLDVRKEAYHWLCCSHILGNSKATDRMNELIAKNNRMSNALKMQVAEIQKNGSIYPITSLPYIEKSEASKTEGCYIATAVYGDYDAEEVKILRKFRDSVLQQCLLGQILVKIYYFLSPPVARWMRKTTHINAFVKKGLNHFVDYLDKKLI